MRKICLAFLVLVAVAPFVAAQSQGRNLSVDDYFRVQRISDPQIRPDGEWIAYTIGTTNLEEEKSEGRIWMVPERRRRSHSHDRGGELGFATAF